MSEYIRFFKNLKKTDAAIAGGKGASLGEMTNAKIPVPEGYVILADSFEKFLKDTDLNVELDAILDSVNHKEMQSIEDASEKIKALILNAKMPLEIENEIKKHFKKLGAKYVAVRSSATAEDSSSAAWAGQLDSFLNTTEKDLLDKVKRCWASLFTPRAIFYRFEKGLHTTKISVAVVVQKMVESEISGIAFSVHPVTQDRNQLIIEAGFGLGEAIVSGQITPDSYVVEKKPRRIIDTNVSEQERGLFKIEGGGNEWRVLQNGSTQKLTEKQILDLSGIILHIEKHYKFPCDIEWALEKDKFYIVQSRPITTLTDKGTDETIPSTEENNSTLIEYARSTEFDIQQAPCSILLADFVFDEYSRAKSLTKIDYTTSLSYHKDKMFYQLSPKSTITRIAEENYRQAIQEPIKFAKKNKDKKLIENTSDKLMYNKNLKKESDESLTKLYEKFTTLSRQWWQHALIGEDKGEIITQKVIPLLAKKQNISLPEANNIVMTLGHPKETALFNQERKEFYKLCIFIAKNTRLRTALNNNQNKKIIENKKFAQKARKYINTFFFIKINWITFTKLTPELIINDIRQEIQEHSLAGVKKELKKIEEGNKKIDSQKSKYKKIRLSQEEQNNILFAKQTIKGIDDRKCNMMKQIYYLYALLDEIAQRTGETFDDVTNLTFSESKELINKNTSVIKNSKTRQTTSFLGIYAQDTKPKYLYGDQASNVFKEAMAKTYARTEVNGQIASKGNTQTVIGKAQIIFNPKKEHFTKGNILITTMTRIDFVPLMRHAKAIITDEGGIACHAAIVSRELGIPCIIGTKNATHKIKNNDLLELDTTNGTVRIINETENKANETFKKEDFFLTGSAESRPLYYYACTIGVAEAVNGLFIVINNNGTSKWFVEKYAVEKLKNHWISLTPNEVTKEFKKWKDKWLKEEQNLLQLSIKPHDDLISAWKKIDVMGAEFWKDSYLVECLDSYADEIEQQITNELISAKLDPQCIHKLIATTSPTRTQNAIIDFSKVTQGKMTKKEYAKKYWYFEGSWIGGEILNENDLTNEYLPTQAETNYEAREKFQKTVLPKLSPKIQALIHLLQTFTLWREERKAIMQMISIAYTTLAKLIAVKEKLNYQDIVWIRPEEINKLKQTNEFSLERAKQSIFLISPKYNPPTLLVGKDTEDIVKEFFPKKTKKEVKGTMACKGIVQGRARIVLKEHHFGKFQKGEILVTTSTRPEFVPIMSLASAIVTDEGGLTSHAAIVSRELKKPCIVGTKHATEIFTDGDLIEVDANKGTVRKLS